MKQVRFAALFLTAILAFGAVVRPVAAQDGPELLKQANAAYDEKSYARAIDLYRKAKAAGAAPLTEDVDYRILVCLFKTEKWDEAITTGEALAGRANWKARVHYVLGQIYYRVPHQGYKVKDKIYRGSDYPTADSAERPQQIYLGEEDSKATLDYFETAKVEAQQERDLAARAKFFAPIYPMTWDQENDLNFDLAGYLPQREMPKFIEAMNAGKGGDENIDPKQSYNKEWSLPKKVIYLYNEIPRLDQGTPKHDSALALLAKSKFIDAYRAQMDSWAQKYDEEKKEYIKRPYPFDSLTGLPLLQQMLELYPRDIIADKVQLLIATTFNSKGDKVRALEEFKTLLAKYPTSRYVGDAKMAIQQITWHEVSFSFGSRGKPGLRQHIYANARNVDRVDFAVYRVPLAELATKTSLLESVNYYFESAQAYLGDIKGLDAKLGKPLATWNWVTGQKGDYQSVTKTLDVPISEIGAYVVVAKADKVRYAGLQIISDLAVIKKANRDNVWVYVANAETGAPVMGANVILKEFYYKDSDRRVSLAQGKSDELGFYSKPWVTGRGNYSNQVTAFAWLGNRFAVLGQSYYYWNNYGDNRAEARVMSYTDRPVYRPDQKVAFRQILTSRVQGGDWKPLTGVKVTVNATNPKGTQFWTKQLTTSEFGSISGDFTIPADAPLGEFNIQAYVESTERNIAASGGSRFRVEEYKRPEFQVTVSAPTEAKRPGETVAARINAKYYFGSPVPNATVKYTVRRSAWYSSYRFPFPYDWLYRYWGAGDYATGRRNVGGEGSGAIVKEGTVKTDAGGNAELSFETAAADPPQNPYIWWTAYSNPLYTIEAEVTDASRRTIEAQGQVKVANQQYFAFLDVKQGYFRQNDRVPVEIRSQDANDQPVAATGKMVVYRVLPNDKQEKVFEEAVQTDAKGYATWTYTAAEAGQFRIAYEAVDAWGKDVRAATVAWVDGPNMKDAKFNLRGVTILLDKRYYAEGDNLKALVVCDEPGSTVVLTQEAGGEVFRRDVITIEGKSREITIPVEKKHVPNFFITAAMVRDYEYFQTQQEVFVPPARQLLNVSVTGDKTEYKPGEKGTFTVKATDYRGQPARAEFSLALIDASLFYIQKDYAPDLRQFYYTDRRGMSTQLDFSRTSTFGVANESDQPFESYQQHGWEQPDDFGQLNLPLGQVYGWYGRNRLGFYPQADLYARRGAVAGFANGLLYDSDMASDRSFALPMAAPASAVHKTSETETRNALLAAETPADVRSNFAETAYWSPAVVTEGGQAKVEVTFPDSVTQWHATARGLTTDVTVGSAESDVVTRKDLMVRLQAPRFFVERDEVTISANVHNYSKKDEDIRVSLAGMDSSILGLASGSKLDQTVRVKAGEEQRVDWQIQVLHDGEATLQVTARTATDSDAVKMSFPVLVHGAQRFGGQSGTLPKDGQITVNLNFPKERRLGASQLNVQLNPSMAAQMLEAIPYLADYPYGCVEQTMSRFLPAALTARVLSDSGVNLDTIRKRAEAYAAEAQAKPLGERIKNSGYSYPKGMPNSRDLSQMASRYWYGHWRSNPVYDPAELKRMTDAGLDRLYNMQKSDGGWGWWSGSGISDPYMSAYVVYGLAQARAAELPVRTDVLDRGYNFLEGQLTKGGDLHLQTYLAYSLSFRGKLPRTALEIASGRLFDQRERLTAYSKSLLAMALWRSGERDKALVLLRNLENTVRIDEAHGSASWKMAPDWWYWYNNDVETNAIALRAFLLMDPDNRLVPMMMKWLTLQARGGHWSSTKATAEAVYTLADYVRRNKELDVDYTLKVNLNGKLVRTYHVTSENALYFDNRFIAGDIFLNDGPNTLTIEKTGKGKLYWNAYTEYFSLEEPIKASGNEISVKRRYFKLTRKAEPKPEEKPAAGAAPLAKRGIVSDSMIFRPVPPKPAEFEYERTELKDGDTLKSGDLVEIELILEAKNDYNYLVFEDMKPAGLEPVDLRSGYAYGDGLCSNMELRDQKVAFFVDYLPQGTRPLRYRMRAEIPGKFHALPTNGYAMYAPEVRAISDEMRLNVKD